MANSNRVIKFRAWYKEKKNMYDVYSIILGSGAVSIWDETEHPSNWLMPNKVELMQFTGLKDKNGKDIYESDLVKEGKKVFKVFWNDLGSGSWWFSSYTKDKEWLHVSKVNVSQLEVIGNIYKNKDLLK